MPEVREFLRLVKPYRAGAVIAFIAVVCGSAIDLVFPWAIKVVLDEVIPAGELRLLAWVAAAMIAAFFLKFGFNFIREYLFAGMGERVVCDLRSRLYWHLQRLSVGYRDTTTSGNLISSLIGDVDSVRHFLFGGMIDFLFSFFSVFFVLAFLLTINWRLTLVALLFMPFYMFAYIAFSPRLKQGHGLVRRKYAELTSRVSEVFNGLRVVAGYAAEEYEKQRFDSAQKEIRDGAMGNHRLAILLWLGAELVSSIGLAVIVWYGGSLVVAGRLTPGSLVAVYSYLGMLFFPLIKLTVIGTHYQEAAAAMNRIQSTLRLEPAVRAPEKPVRPVRLKGEVAFNSVSFGYSDGKNVLSGIDLAIPAGRTLAITGKSGAGKTTLVNLLLRFYDPRSGTVSVDGIDIRRFDLAAYRSRLAVVLQDDYLFDGMIRENIRYGRPDATDAEVEAAARAANAHEFISALPRGYESAVGEAGVRLSCGQRQRVSIARALLRDPAILVLDEATASVDTGTEQRIVEDAYRNAMAGRTTIIIAHRLAVIRAADRIVYLRDGVIAEQGSHAELLSLGGLYSRLWNGQEKT